MFHLWRGPKKPVHLGLTRTHPGGTPPRASCGKTEELMDQPAEFRVNQTPEGTTVALTGKWSGSGVDDAGRELAKSLATVGPFSLDLSGVERMDTTAAYLLIRAAGERLDLSATQGRPEVKRLLELVSKATSARVREKLPPRGFHEMTIRIGRGVIELWREFIDTMVFVGHLLVVLGRLIVRPQRVRWAACFSLAERAGLDAVPIVATTSFFIGAVVGLLGVNTLRQFGAEVFSVDLIGIAVLREFNIVIAAILLAGRSASAFAAEIGSMKMNQEIDAMLVLGIDPFEALVFPRFAALLVTVPLLTFVATLAGLFGGLLITWSILGVGPAFFLQRILDNVGPTHFWIGMSKAPVMAAVIAGIGCRQGLEVGGDVESLGRRVTAAVVHATFAIIMIDALFALLYMEMDL